MNFYSFICGMRSRDYGKIDLIYTATLKLIEKDGIAGLTMAKIAKESMLATGTIYIYFKNKEDLINELYRKLERESVSRFLKGYSQDMGFRDSLKLVWMNYLNHRIDYHSESIFLEQYYRSPYITDSHKSIAESMKTPVYAIIQKGMDEGFVVDDVDVEMLFLAMLGFIRELADEHVDGVYVVDNEKIEQAFNLSWKMLQK